MRNVGNIIFQESFDLTIFKLYVTTWLTCQHMSSRQNTYKKHIGKIDKSENMNLKFLCLNCKEIINHEISYFNCRIINSCIVRNMETDLGRKSWKSYKAVSLENDAYSQASHSSRML